MPIWKVKVSIETLQERCADGFASLLGIYFSEVGEDYLKATLPLGPHLLQPMGILHGGVSCAFAETMGSTAGNCCVDPSLEYCVGLDININHLHSIRSGLLIAITRPYHLGRRTQVWSIHLSNERGKLIAVSRLTLAVLSKKS